MVAAVGGGGGALNVFIGVMDVSCTWSSEFCRGRYSWATRMHWTPSAIVVCCSSDGFVNEVRSLPQCFRRTNYSHGKC